VDPAGDHADPDHPRHAAACPPPPSRTSLRSKTADAGTHGHRTPDAWTLRRPHRTLDTGRVDRHAWTLDARTGRRTPDAGRGRGHGDEGTAGVRTSWATTPNGLTLGHPTVFLCTAPAALGNHDGSALGHLPERDCLLALPASCSVTPPAAKRRLGALLSSDDFGSRVEREAQGQVLWRVRVKLAGEGGSCGRLWVWERAGQRLSGATFCNWGAHALLGSLPVRTQWPGLEAAGPAARW
jgi:hypothetical protein